MTKSVRNNPDFITFGAPFIGQEEINEVIATLKSGWIGTGPRTALFEKMVGDYTGAKFSRALNSCTAALHLSLLACGIKPGDEVITSPLTFVSTANVILHCNAKPVFVDVRRDTMNINPDLIEEKITSKTKAIIPVHLAGRPCEMDKIIKIANNHRLHIIEDAAHAIGAKYKGEKIGTIGELTCFSFYATKNITTSEGGMVTTDNKTYANKIGIYSLHGLSRDAWKRYSTSGYNITRPPIQGTNTT